MEWKGLWKRFELAHSGAEKLPVLEVVTYIVEVIAARRCFQILKASAV